MFTYHRTKGFYLGEKEHGEANIIFTVFTKDFGKIKILGRAIRKIKSKLRPGTKIFSLSEIEFIQGKIYKTLTDAVLIDEFKNIKKSPEKLKIAFGIAEILDSFVKGEEKDNEIWQLLYENFQKLNNCTLSAAYCSLIYYYFFWNLVSISGYKPELYYCSICRKKLIPENLYFSSKEGGIICKNCFKKMDKKARNLIFKININVVKLLRLIIKKDWKVLERLRIEQDDKNILDFISVDRLNKIK